MPLYEYECDQDGSVLELRRPMASADDPVDDPAGRGRTFRRRLSTFQAKSAAPATTSVPWSGGSCACGKPSSGCSHN